MCGVYWWHCLLICFHYWSRSRPRPVQSLSNSREAKWSSVHHGKKTRIEIWHLFTAGLPGHKCKKEIGKFCFIFTVFHETVNAKKKKLSDDVYMHMWVCFVPLRGRCWTLQRSWRTAPWHWWIRGFGLWDSREQAGCGRWASVSGILVAQLVAVKEAEAEALWAPHTPDSASGSVPSVPPWPRPPLPWSPAGS